MKLIELHCCEFRVAIDAERVTGIREDEEGCYIWVDGEESSWAINESYDEVLEMIREATAELEPEDFLIPGFLETGGMSQ